MAPSDPTGNGSEIAPSPTMFGKEKPYLSSNTTGASEKLKLMLVGAVTNLGCLGGVKKDCGGGGKLSAEIISGIVILWASFEAAAGAVSAEVIVGEGKEEEVAGSLNGFIMFLGMRDLLLTMTLSLGSLMTLPSNTDETNTPGFSEASFTMKPFKLLLETADESASSFKVSSEKLF